MMSRAPGLICTSCRSGCATAGEAAFETAVETGIPAIVQER
jgi:hypothetical protein